MKNHLSIEASIFSAGRSWLGGRGGSCEGSTRLGDCWTATLVLMMMISMQYTDKEGRTLCGINFIGEGESKLTSRHRRRGSCR